MAPGSIVNCLLAMVVVVDFEMIYLVLDFLATYLVVAIVVTNLMVIPVKPQLHFVVVVAFFHHLLQRQNFPVQPLMVQGFCLAILLSFRQL